MEPSGRCFLSNSLPFLRNPVRNARQLWACQPVAFCSSPRLAPFARDSSLITVADLDARGAVVDAAFAARRRVIVGMSVIFRVSGRRPAHYAQATPTTL